MSAFNKGVIPADLTIIMIKMVSLPNNIKNIKWKTIDMNKYILQTHKQKRNYNKHKN